MVHDTVKESERERDIISFILSMNFSVYTFHYNNISCESEQVLGLVASMLF